MKLKSAVSKMPVQLGDHWLMLLVTVALFILVAVFVDLKPVVDENFSFQPATRSSNSLKRRRQKKMASVGGRARRTMAWDCLFGRHHRGWLRDFCAVRFSADATFQPCGACRLYHRHPGKPVRLAVARRCSIEKEIITSNAIMFA